MAHRLQTVADYDQIVVMSSGRVIECGSPAELLGRRGEFYEMVRQENSGSPSEMFNLSMKN